MNVPTKTSEMREAIILALANMHRYSPDQCGFLQSEIQFRVWYQINGDNGWWDESYFGDRSSAGRAWERAFEQLKAEGVISKNPDDPNEIEYALTVCMTEQPNVQG